jgi:hypothetical protein
MIPSEDHEGARDRFCTKRTSREVAVVVENEIKVLRFMSGMSVDQQREPDGNTLAFLYGQHVGLEAIQRREVL